MTRFEELQTKEMEYSLLCRIVDGEYRYPLDFALREYLGWDHTKTSAFIKQYKKTRNKRKKDSDKEVFDYDMNASGNCKSSNQLVATSTCLPACTP